MEFTMMMAKIMLMIVEIYWKTMVEDFCNIIEMVVDIEIETMKMMENMIIINLEFLIVIIGI